jgi:hypothetical protein
VLFVRHFGPVVGSASVCLVCLSVGCASPSPPDETSAGGGGEFDAAGPANPRGGAVPGSPGPDGDASTVGTTPVGTATPSGNRSDASTIVFADAGASPVTEASSVPCTSQGQCIHACGDGGHTTVSGTVYDPAGHNPLYGIAVYVPQQTPAPIATGASCSKCGDSYTGGVLASAVTDAKGHFTIVDAPDGPGVPLVVQIGKWRMQYGLSSVARCQDNPQADGSLHLPRNHVEGDLPSIAVSTGGADSLECLLSRIGVDATEYVGGAGAGGSIHIFQGAGGANNTAPPGPDSPAGLWATTADLMAYDMVILSCEGDETSAPNPVALHEYAAMGGRVFASHFHYAWFSAPGSPFLTEGLARWTPGPNQMPGTTFGLVQTTLPSGAPFPKGQALRDWLDTVNALGPSGELAITAARHNADVTAANVSSTPWIAADQNAIPPGATQYFSWDTPVAQGTDGSAEVACGRVVYSDLHVGAASGDQIGGVCPDGCANNPLSPQEKALEFMLFDLSSCLTPLTFPPPPPAVRPPT